VLDMIAGAYDITAYQQSATTDEVLPVGEHAYLRGTWTVAPTGEAEGDTFDGKWSALFRPGPDGSWQLWRWMWNQPSDQAPTSTP
ncbi:MAG: hypothetical protein GWN71_43395, partial [Gammaproteobacteria bacterium]|nr:hypothetical protein [Gemmatimonadota bacterium]NIR41990.1 hypothetical protein [Actinomycetota bacterium]NIU80138.1 hypothetical protein [Gammaproteobacteria bacterium]NIX25638.1 hypothetical protein [Actinomycetota bacterium]